MKNRSIFFTMIIVIISVIYFNINYIIDINKNKIYQISVITQCGNDEKWKIALQGMEQAANEMNAEIKFISLTGDNCIQEQINAIENEIKTNNSDALIISVSDSIKMKNSIENIIEKIPIILIETNIYTNKNINYISCNNYKLGKSLAEEVYSSGITRNNIAIITTDNMKNNIEERKNGFIEIIKNTKNNISFYEIPSQKDKSIEFMKNLLINPKIDCIIALDTEELEMLGNIKSELKANKENTSEIYGIGNSSKIVYYLEDGIIDAIGVQNEYNMGYLSIYDTINIIKNKKPTNYEIDFKVINVHNMYSEENEKILFPFVK